MPLVQFQTLQYKSRMRNCTMTTHDLEEMRERLAATYLQTLSIPSRGTAEIRAKLSSAFILTGSRLRSRRIQIDAALSTQTSRVSKSRPSPDYLSLSEITLPLPFLHRNEAWAQYTLAIASWHKTLRSYSTH